MNTMQQEFDAVVAHLYKQGRPATVASRCFYRTTASDGSKLSCAVGCRIPDDVYRLEMDTIAAAGTGFSTLMKNHADVLPPEFKAYPSLYDCNSLTTFHPTIWMTARSTSSGLQSA
jgi:hypothetical protein